MARHDHRQPVLRAGTRHRARRRWPAQRSGELRVAQRLPGRDLHQRLPHALLEGGADQFDVQARGLPGQHLRDLAHARGEEFVAAFLHARQARLRELGAQSGFERGGIVAERDRAQPAIGGRHQRLPERGVYQRPADLQPFAATPVGARRHAEARGAVLVHAAGGPITSLEQRAGDVAIAAQLALEGGEFPLRAEFGGTQSEGGAEAALQMRRTQSHARAQLLKGVIPALQHSPRLLQPDVHVLHGRDYPPGLFGSLSGSCPRVTRRPSRAAGGCGYRWSPRREPLLPTQWRAGGHPARPPAIPTPPDVTRGPQDFGGCERVAAEVGYSPGKSARIRLPQQIAWTPQRLVTSGGWGCSGARPGMAERAGLSWQDAAY